MLMRNKQLLNKLLVDLTKILVKNKDKLFELNQKITLDTNYWIREDYRAIILYLRNYIKHHYSDEMFSKLKPKGKILIILSYNEPFILSIIPILNALVAGNKVILKISAESEDFVRSIWEYSGLIDRYKLNLNIIVTRKHNEIIKYIKEVRAVYFFGSHKIAKIISKVCGKYYVEFYPEIETADIKIFNKKISDINSDTLLTLRESFSHSGQICHRIQGIFVHKNVYHKYVQVLKQKFIKLCQSENINDFIYNNYVASRSNLLNLLMVDLDVAKPSSVIKVKDLPLLIIRPKIKSKFINSAYFLPVLWVYPFNSTKELVEILNSRKFFLGLNIQSDKEFFIKQIIKKTKFTRYTINISHTNIAPYEGWGGSWPSGYSGYKKWIEHFSDSYVIINK